MKLLRALLGLVVLAAAWLLHGAESATADKPATADKAGAASKAGANPLVWDSNHKTVKSEVEAISADFQFSVTNSSDQPIEVYEIRTSCGCTVAEMPKSPWVLEPHGTGSFKGTVDIRGRRGLFSKSLLVLSAAGSQMLGVTVDIPPVPVRSREENMARAKGDRQAVFHGTCYECHVDPIGGKEGALLYKAACTICHEAEPRATMVPDLMVAKEHRDENYWRQWITEGRDDTLMPAFGEQKGGPLSERQIESLVKYLSKQMPSDPAAGK